MFRFTYSAEHLDFLREQYRDLSLAELTHAFNDRFRLARPQSSIRAALRNHGIRSGRTGQFKKNQEPWNLGKKGYMGANATSFKAGNLPHNKKRLWSERIGKDGYIEISVPERNPHTGHPTRYKHKHVWLWECAHGKIPKGHAIIFSDGDKRNFAPDNLVSVTRTELLALNLHSYKNQPEELKPTVMALAKLEAAAGFRTKPGQGRKGATP